jgi:D-glycerate 3-kinase
MTRATAHSSPDRSAATKEHTPSAFEQAMREKMTALQLPRSFADVVRTTYREIAGALLARKARVEGPLVVGVCGSQGSGKSTLVAFLKLLLDWEMQSTAVLSLDDLYMTKRQRERLAREIHPLLTTRGVPGTHDVSLGLKTLKKLCNAGVRSRTALPAFEKARDDRKPRKDWQVFKGRPAFILLEGWCVDARPQTPAALIEPVNRLERDCDPDGIWRGYVNDQLAGPYRDLFAPIDVLLFLKAPSFDCVYKWRGLQEKKLRRSKRGRAVMNRKELENFIMHYERLTRWMLKEMPVRADILLPLDTEQNIHAVKIRSRRTKTAKPSK